MINRRIEIEKIEYISISTKNTEKFALHCPKEYDYYLISKDKRTPIIETIVENYINRTGKPMRIYQIPEDDLSMYITYEGQTRTDAL